MSEQIPVAVIGGGFSGAIIAVQLSRILPEGRPIVIFERSEQIGSGLAYATDNEEHLLNVRAANMSAFPDQPDHFEAWLAGRSQDCHTTEAGLFSSRRLYGRYVTETFQQAGRIKRQRCSIVDCRRGDDGFILTDETGRDHPVAAVVLATGHVAPAPGADPRQVTNPWDLAYLDGLDPDKPILILGTALTMVDILLTLRRSGYRGPVTALSRRGLLPRAHRPALPWPTPDFTAAERASVLGTMRRLREEVRSAAAQGVDWRSVIDSIRPITADLWRGWDQEQKLRFLRHARRWWDIHRHRMAPPNAEALEQERASGGLTATAGRITSLLPGAGGISVTWRDPKGVEKSGSFQRVISATGLEKLGQDRTGLIGRLLERGLVRLDPLEIGLDVTGQLETIGRPGVPTPGLWAVGPLVRGTFWECIAVPDIRRQAADCAARVADYLPLTTTFPVMCG